MKIEESTAQEPVNILRERTFNKELRNLVSRVSSNEGEVEDLNFKVKFSSIDDKIKKADSLSPAQLQRELHELFYSISNSDSKCIEAQYNPLTMSGSYEDHLKHLLKQGGVDLHALFQYSLIDKVYRPFINTIPSLDEENLVISIRGDLYKRLVNEKTGIIIEKEDIEKDWTLRKGLSQDNRYFAVFVKHAMYDVYKKLGPQNISVKSFYPEMIFFMVIPEGYSNTEAIMTFLRTNCAVPLAMLHEDIVEKIDGQSSNEMLFNLVDYISESANRRGINNALLVEFNKTKLDLAPYMVKFFFSKLERVLSISSFAFRMDICETMIIASQDELIEVESIVNSLNETDDYFSMDFMPTSRPEAIYLKLID